PSYASSFQSSPDPKAGRYPDHQQSGKPRLGFNPRPTRRPGATSQRVLEDLAEIVSILARPEGRALPYTPRNIKCQ
ncbi:MAG: hypothetical protein ACE5JU_15800, partial [Candidatus Binatia bacterium]